MKLKKIVQLLNFNKTDYSHNTKGHNKVMKRNPGKKGKSEEAELWE